MASAMVSGLQDFIGPRSRYLIPGYRQHVQIMTKQSYYICILKRLYALIKKEKNIFLIYQEVQMGSVAKSYMRKGFLTYEEMRKYLVMYEEAVSHITDPF
jgi:hypothetical protein